MPKRKSSKKVYSRNRSTGRYRKNSKNRSRSKRRSPIKGNNKYQVAVEYYAPPNFKKSKYGTLIMNLESVMDEDENGNNIYFHLARVKAINRSNLLKYLNGIGNLKRILEIDEL
jgi:hypothetical protein